MAPRRIRKDPSRQGDGVRKGRGLAKKTKKWGKEKLNVVFNEYGQPCGGDNDKLASQLGFFVKNGENFPLNKEWSEIDGKVLDNIWKDVQDNTNAPPEYKKICFTALDRSWKDWRYSVRQIYNSYETDEERLAMCPESVVKEQWIDLVKHVWCSEQSKEVSKVNKINRSKQECPNRTGKKSHSQLRKEREDAQLPVDRISMFIVTRTDKAGQSVDLTTSRMILTLNDAIDELPEEEQSSPSKREKIFTDIIGKDGRGRMRCMGLGVTKSMVFGKASTTETVAAVRAEFEEKLESQKISMEAEFARRQEAQEAEFSKRLEAFQRNLMQQLQGNVGFVFQPPEEQN